MAWFAELAGKAEHVLNNLDEQTGAALRNHNVINPKKRMSSPNGLNPPEALGGSKKRPLQRGFQKAPNNLDSSCNIGLPKKPVPVYNLTSRDNERGQNSATTKFRKSPNKLYNLNHSPKTLVSALKNDDHSDTASRHRRGSLPSNQLDYSAAQASFQMENIELENSLLKEELSGMRKETSELVAKLTAANDELSKANEKAEKAAALYAEVTNEKGIMSDQLLQLKTQVTEFTTNELQKYKNQNREMETENTVLRDRIKEMEQKITRLNQSREDQETMYQDLENQLLDARNDIKNLQNDLDKSKQECKRLDSDWETYKVRVKTMLAGKDKEIKALQNGLNLSEDTKALISQIDNLKAERSMLSDAMTRVRCECEDMKQYMDTLESRHSAAERVVVALRDALRDERAARNRAETQANSLAKDLKSIQIEMGQTIASLRTALRDKEQEMSRLVTHASSSSIMRASNSSTLNVADYEVCHGTESSVDEDKVSLLSQKLLQRQKQVEDLTADNNMMKIQMDKFQKQCKNRPMNISNENEVRRDCISRPHSNTSNTLEQLQNSAQTWSRNQRKFGLAKLSRRISSVIRAYPILRICVIFYMIFLQIWVVTVLYSKIDYKPKEMVQPNAEN